MGNDDDDAFAFAHAKNCMGQRFVALGVEVGVRLIENDEEWIAVDCAGERDPLRLAGGKRSALLADRRVVALRQRDNQVMNADFFGRRDYRFGVGLDLESGDVLRHRAAQQLNVLR